MLPWGTPHVILIPSNYKLATDTKYPWSFKQDSNQFSAMPEGRTQTFSPVVCHGQTCQTLRSSNTENVVSFSVVL